MNILWSKEIQSLSFALCWDICEHLHVSSLWLDVTCVIGVSISMNFGLNFRLFFSFDNYPLQFSLFLVDEVYIIECDVCIISVGTIVKWLISSGSHAMKLIHLYYRASCHEYQSICMQSCQMYDPMDLELENGRVCYPSIFTSPPSFPLALFVFLKKERVSSP